VAKSNKDLKLGLISLYEDGNYDEAKKSAAQFLEMYPDDGFGWKLLGAILSKTSKFDEALSANKQATVQSPNDPEAHNSLGFTLDKLGRFESAIRSFEKAIRLNPHYGEAHYNLANAYFNVGKIEKAKYSYGSAIEINPAFAPAHNNLGNLLHSVGRYDDAEVSYKNALSLAPYYAEAHCNLGMTYKAKGLLELAEECYREAINSRPDYAEAHNNLGNVQTQKGVFKEAINSYEKAIKIRPDFYKAHTNLGSAFKRSGKLQRAEASYRRALKLNARYSETHYNLGVLLYDLDRFEEAEFHYNECMALDPTNSAACCNLGVLLQDMGRLADSEAQYRKALKIKPNFPIAHSNLLFLLNAFYEETEKNFDEALKYPQVARYHSVSQFTHESPGPRKELRIGFVSGDFKNHPVGYFLEGFLNCLQNHPVKLFAYSNKIQEDETTYRIKKLFYKWIDISNTDDHTAASLIYRDNIDILLDLSGHTAKNRLPIFLWKPAPLQITWLGYFSTTGLSVMDYLLGDNFVTPANSAERFSEEIYQLPDSYLCLTPPSYDLEVTPLPALKNGYVTFCCFNKLPKLNKNVLVTWGKIMEKVAGSHLFLKDKSFSLPSTRDTLIDSFESVGIARHRLIFEGSSSRYDYLRAYNQADIALSPFPYGGGTTSAEGLWMGVPFVTKEGSTFISRIGKSIAGSTGLSNWVSDSEEDYIEKAVKFSSDLSQLSALRASLRDQVLASPMFNSERFSENFILALHTLWSRHHERI
tara:strand:- start:761 stop:3028 length:2268 start_codon:yes stop_codon:yes gene_type:complete